MPIVPLWPRWYCSYYMTTKHNSADSFYKPIVYGVLSVYILTMIGLVMGFPSRIPAEWWGPLFTIDYPLHILAPIAAFSIGYFALKQQKKWSGLFNGLVFLASYWWLQTLLIGVVFFAIPPIASSYIGTLIHSGIPCIAPLILLSLYVHYARRHPKAGTIGLRREFMLYTISITVLTVLLQSTFIALGAINGNMVFNEYTLSSNLTSVLSPAIFILITVIGYCLLARMKQPLTQLYLAVIAGTVYVFTAYAWIYIFGSMPAETWLIVGGNILGLLGSFILLQRVKLAYK